MWLNKDTKKPMSLKKIIQSEFDVDSVIPETLVLACPITNGVQLKQREWLMELEKLASEVDPYLVEIHLKRLLEQVS